MSKSYEKFQKNTTDIDNLLEMHEDITEGKVGKPAGKVNALNKAGFVLVCAFWQSYCEEVLFEILRSYRSGKSGDVPAALQIAIGARVLSQFKRDDNAYWKTLAAGWPNGIENLVKYLEGDRTRPLDSPTSDNVDATFKHYLGIDQMSKAWHWNKMSVKSASTKLDDAIRRRHRLAHRGNDVKVIRKADVTEFSNHVGRLVEKTEEALQDADFLS